MAASSSSSSPMQAYVETSDWLKALQVVERRLRPQHEQALRCPRCDSTDTKFCYYNNYSLSQPRYFCKTCRRYWTKGGSLPTFLSVGLPQEQTLLLRFCCFQNHQTILK
ncbi:hypothetical protein HPP92_003795 [Vanilla planifolia]|uniref:Dof zinc finger protein n=1 Tax=Vanilla planifolia TaxID=51239 RepID=A0A835VFT9_VANPL|nr:hypothetical protein HPP92_003795 [Vanilla planifolia]